MTTIKILVLSDSHGDVGTMLEIAEREHPNEIFHLGDCVRDAESLSFACPETPVIMVPGNCDGWTGMSERLLLERNGVRILLAHGHRWHVKSGVGGALADARMCGADILLYGHTHQAVCCTEEDGLWRMNPGTAGGVYAPATYGVVLLEGGKISCEVKPVPSEEIE